MFATVSDFIGLFGEAEALQLTRLDTPQADEVNPTVIERALVLATDEAASYLSGAGYCLPLEVCPPTLKQAALDIARYRLEHISPREDTRQRYEDAIAWLEKIGKGLVRLALPCGAEAAGAEQGAGQVDWASNGRIFTDNRLSEYTRLRNPYW